jgi:hypothetical protein
MVLIYRWMVFLLAAFFMLRFVIFSDYRGGFGPF